MWSRGRWRPVRAETGKKFRCRGPKPKALRPPDPEKWSDYNGIGRNLKIIAPNIRFRGVFCGPEAVGGQSGPKRGKNFGVGGLNQRPSDPPTPKNGPITMELDET